MPKTELSGLELRKAACKAVGIKPQFDRDHDLEREIWPPCESVVAVAWSLLERWLRGGDSRMVTLVQRHGASTCRLHSAHGGFSSTVPSDDEAALPTAICRALVAAGGE